MKFYPRNLAAILAVFAVSLMAIANAGADYPEEIPFVPTPMNVVDQMLELAEVKKGEVVYDLGSGDGRIVIRAAKKFGVKAVGIEMDSLLLKKARKDAKAAGVSHLVEFRAEDALKADGGRLLLRYSGTEPKARLLMEGRNAALLETWSKKIADAIKRQIGAEN